MVDIYFIILWYLISLIFFNYRVSNKYSIVKDYQNIKKQLDY